MGRKQEDQLHDKVNAQIGFMRSQLSSIAAQVMHEMLDANKLQNADEMNAAKNISNEIVKRFRAAMPMMKPDEE